MNLHADCLVVLAHFMILSLLQAPFLFKQLVPGCLDLTPAKPTWGKKIILSVLAKPWLCGCSPFL